MELTAEALQQIAFGAKVRGYDPEQVDKFIDDVIEAGEELHERLRRATDRATQAEHKLATAPADVAAPVPAAAATSAMPMGEMGKIWEKAAAAAEEALEEARQEAAQIRADARRESDEQIGKARREAASMAEQAQSQLREDIQRLESARDRLKTDVDGLSSYLQNEKSRLRDTIAGALNALDSYGDASGKPPTISAVEVPSQPAPAPQPQWNDAPAQQEETFGGWEQPAQSDQPADWAGSSESSDSQGSKQQPSDQGSDNDEEGDPFLAELRRAVRDDGPLGPREDETDDDSIDNLYASDDDKNFFRRKK